MALLREDLVQVERVLRESMRSVVSLLPEVGEHTFAAGGKRIRPVLVLLASRLCGYRGPRAIQIASAAEYFHSASLLHDDVVDGALQRRGRPSVNAAFGNRNSILVGDFMYARACQILVEDGNIDILSHYADALRQMTEGEVLQLSQSFDPEISESIYIEVIGRKTSSLLAASAESGAILGGVTRAEQRALRDYGWKLGLAFQLVDDALDYVGDSESLGKEPLKDLIEGKVTLPLLATLKRCSVAERDALIGLVKGKLERSDLERIASAVREHQGVELTLTRASEHAASARACIEAFVDNDAKQALIHLTDFVVERDH